MIIAFCLGVVVIEYVATKMTDIDSNLAEREGMDV